MPAAEAESPESAPDLWVAILTAGVVRGADFTSLTHAFHGRVTAASGSLRRRWREAAVNIGRTLRATALARYGATAAIPSLADYMNCMTPSEWRSWTRGSRLPRSIDEIQVRTETCPDRAVAQNVRNWTRQMLILRAGLLSLPYSRKGDNILADVLRYRIWSREMAEDSSRAAPSLGSESWREGQERLFDCYFHSSCFSESQQYEYTMAGLDTYFWANPGSDRLDRLWMRLGMVWGCTDNCATDTFENLY
jgi:hypothetical protein